MNKKKFFAVILFLFTVGTTVVLLIFSGDNEKEEAIDISAKKTNYGLPDDMANQTIPIHPRLEVRAAAAQNTGEAMQTANKALQRVNTELAAAQDEESRSALLRKKELIEQSMERFQLTEK